MFNSYYDGHYHPLTLCSLALDYRIGEFNPRAYHTTNLILHLLNVSLVFIFIYFLFPKRNLYLAIIASLLFGIATINVESVAWASERKNLLYAFFYFASLIAYLKYLNQAKPLFYFLSLLLFILSSLSKAMAIPLCFTLLVIDYFYDRKLLSKKVVFEKLPFFAIALSFGLIAIFAQQSTWGEGLSQQHYPFYQRIMFASFAYAQYVLKAFVPYQIAGFYPYPEKLEIGNIIIYLLSMLAIIGLIILFFKKFKTSKVFTFSFLFFSVNIFLLLKLFEVPAGDYIMADRYNYVSSVGLFLFAGFGLNYLFEKFAKYKMLFLATFAIYIGIMGYSSFKHTKVWENDLRFYSNIISHFPDAHLAYLNRGGIRKEKGNLKGALTDFNKAVKLRPDDYKSVSNRASVNMDMGQFDKALSDFRKADQLKPNNPDIIGKLGYTQLKLGQFSEAIATLSISLKLNQNNAEVFTNRGTAKFSLGDLQGAISDYSTAVKIDSSYLNAQYNLGLAYLNLNQAKESIMYFEKAISLKADHAEAYANLAVAWSRLGKQENAFQYYTKALTINPSNYEVYLNRGIDYFFMENFELSLTDINHSIQLNPNMGASYYFRAMITLKTGSSIPCEDLKTAIKLGFARASSEFNIHCK